jgi:hypothetical protein
MTAKMKLLHLKDQEARTRRREVPFVFFGAWRHLTKDGRVIHVDIVSHDLEFPRPCGPLGGAP